MRAVTGGVLVTNIEEALCCHAVAVNEDRRALIRSFGQVASERSQPLSLEGAPEPAPQVSILFQVDQLEPAANNEGIPVGGFGTGLVGFFDVLQCVFGQAH